MIQVENTQNMYSMTCEDGMVGSETLVIVICSSSSQDSEGAKGICQHCTFRYQCLWSIFHDPIN